MVLGMGKDHGWALGEAVKEDWTHGGRRIVVYRMVLY
jgi:hypothetical protein